MHPVPAKVIFMSDSLVTLIAPDLYQARLPLPFALRLVNIYLLRGPHGWTILDTGIHTAAGEAAWREIFNTLDFTPAQIDQIILTHVHPDHVGMAGWLTMLGAEAGHNIPIYSSPREDEQMRHVWCNPAANDNFGAWLLRGGMPHAMAAEVGQHMGDTYRMTLPHPPPFKHLAPESMIEMGGRIFRAIHAPGHSDGQLLFYQADEQMILSGDQVLMKITPNIGLWSQSDPDPLGNFLTSLTSLQSLPVKLGLPGHKQLITDWAGRIGEILSHHTHRLEQVQNALADGHATPYSISNVIFETSRFTPHEWRFSLAESLAHLDYLQRCGLAEQQNDVGEAWQFAAASESAT